MEFLKSLFESGPLSYEQLVEKATAAKIRAVNLAEGGYISVDKHNDKINQLTEQVNALNGQIAQRDTDMTDLQGKLTAAQADATKLGEAQNALTELQGRYATEKSELEGKLKKQAYEFTVREKAGGLKFSCAAAKKAFVQEAISKEFKQEGEQLLGFEDFVTKYKADDPGAFMAEPQEPNEGQGPNQPAIVAPTQPQPGGNSSAFGFSFAGVRPKPAK